MEGIENIVDQNSSYIIGSDIAQSHDNIRQNLLMSVQNKSNKKLEVEDSSQNF